MHDFHNRRLEEFMDSVSETIDHSLPKNERFFLGVDNFGYAVPLHVEFKLEMNFHAQLSGLVGEMTVIKSKSSFAMVEMSSSFCMILSKKF
jgi:hypothetical protein